MFYTFSQNNSGGFMKTDLWTGISHYVIVEANDAMEANRRARDVGVYFDGAWDGPDCDCCGDRWSRVGAYDADAVPSIYGKDIHNPETTAYVYVADDDEPEGFVHYLDGRVEAIYMAGSVYSTSSLRVIPWGSGEAIAA